MGKGGERRGAQQLARQPTTKAIQTLIALLDSNDDRVRAVAANSLWDKAGGNVMENNPERESGKPLDLSKLSLPELQFLLKLAKSGALQMTEALPAAMDGDAIEVEAK